MRTNCRRSKKLDRLSGRRGASGRSGGFSLIELLIGITILSIGLLAIASMFSTGYVDVAAGGKTTMAANAARQIIEEMRNLPFQSLANLHNFRTDRPDLLPASNPEREVARKWRYILSGNGTGWGFTAAEIQRWGATGTMGTETVPFGGVGSISVVNQTATLQLVTINLTIPGRPAASIATLISRL
jgi:prepilin-type N-terminal cleavage/methylation domain-containing protein